MAAPDLAFRLLERAAGARSGDARFARSPIAVVRDRNEVVIASDCEEIVRERGDASFAAINEIQRRGGFWVGAVSYDLGRSIEHIEAHTSDDRDFDDLVFARFATVTRIPIATFGKWLGAPGTLRNTRAFDLGAMRSSISELDYEDRVHTIKAHLLDGTCYQVNLSRRLTSPIMADPVALFARLALANPAPHGALLQLDDVAIVSASPERMLRVHGRNVLTSPIKGTGRDASRLATSQKDRAEHVMIVDLARNDLGRVCGFGSVAVPDLERIEHHPGLVHMVSDVVGMLGPDVSLSDLLRATFPAASITGAPKPKVMQIIEDLEPVRRGFYCGAVGWIDGEREVMDLAVAIRTFTISRAGTDLGVGGGVVWDSIPSAEWAETQLKAARLLQAANGFETEPSLVGATS